VNARRDQPLFGASTRFHTVLASIVHDARSAGARLPSGLVARHDCNDRRSVQVLASLGPASRTAFKTFSTEGLKKNRTFLATVLPSTWTVSSPRLPFTTSTSTPGSFRKASATRAACSRVPPQTGHWRMVTFFIADLLSI